jgi:hypothetical protein
VGAILKELPAWAGTVPQWGLFFLLLIAVVRTSPQWISAWVKMRLVRSNQNAERIRELVQQVRECRTECDEKIEALQLEIYGIRTQRVSEQIALMRAILRTVESPELRKQLELLEAMQISLPPVNVGGPIKDGVKK